MKWTAPEPSKTTAPQHWLHLHYYDALNTLFRIENTLRLIAYIVLKRDLGKKWVDYAITRDETQTSTIAATAKQRATQQADFGYIAYPVNCHLLHLTSGELIRLMLSDAGWKLFKGFFPAKREIIQSKLDEITTIRNAIAHFRPIRQEDASLVKLNAMHVLSQAEAMISSLFKSHSLVPTNTDADWYRDVMALSSDACVIRVLESGSLDWKHLELSFDVELHAQSGEYPYFQFRSMRIDPVAFMERAEAAVNWSVSVRQRIMVPKWGRLEKDAKQLPKITTSIIFVIPVCRLETNRTEIARAFQDAIVATLQEMSLVRADPRAMGKIIRYEQVYSRLKGEMPIAVLDCSSLRCPVSEKSPPEYWATGGTDLESGNFISEAEYFPWMPVSIADGDVIPF